VSCVKKKTNKGVFSSKKKIKKKDFWQENLRNFDPCLHPPPFMIITIK
jgi:hypothetical protein